MFYKHNEITPFNLLQDMLRFFGKQAGYILLFIFLGLNSIVYSQMAKNILKTIPSSVAVFDDKDNKLGITPFDLNTLSKDSTKIVLEFDGYRKIFIEMNEKPRVGYQFPKDVKFCGGCLIQHESDTKKSDFYGSIKLRKKFKDSYNKVMVFIDEPVFDIDKEATIGMVNNAKKKLKNKDINRLLGFTTNMEQQLINPVQDSYIDAYFFPAKKNKKKDEATMYLPKIVMKPIVKKMNFDLNGKLLRDYTGPMDIEVEWQISDMSDTNIIHSKIIVQSKVYRTGGNYDLILHELLRNSELDLLESDTLHNYLAALEKEYLSKSKGEEFKLTPASEVVYKDNKDMLKNVIQSVVTIETGNQFGSGSFISEDGYILTNYHVIDGGKTIYAKRGNEEKVKATIVKINKDYDLALIKVEMKNIKGLTFGSSKSSQLGEELYAAGTPLEKSLGQTVTKGILSGYREWNGVNFIQTDVSINSGNSGGPLLNTHGQILGVTTMSMVGIGVSGIGFAIPSDVVIEMLNLILE